MAFKGAAGYGDLFSYTKNQIIGDGFEVKNLAGSIMRKAISELVFGRVMNESRDAFGKGKGGTFTIPIFNDWGAPGTVTPLTSGTAISVGTQNTSSVSMVIHEYGTGIGFEPFGDWVTDLDIREQLTDTLARHVARSVNFLDYDVLVNTQHSIEVTSAGTYSKQLGTNRQLVATAYGELGPGGIAMAYDTFRTSIASPVTSRGMYAIIGNAETFRNLKQGSVFQNMSLYSDMRGLRWQVLGEFMNFLFIETEELLGKGTSIAVAANAGGYGFGLLPRTWYYPDFGSDAGRLEVWKTKFYRGQGPIWAATGTACIVIRSCSSAYNYNQLG